ncbi:magnesium transporter [Roseovarius sp. SCSIO 43702]|uniref:magnesium transporter n=1 Tax=Roseovarius sp. SCSIO 43702 TaxID=2823043 RepID=UPI001C7353B8|nr:magnesium transporter [Roseovarius sp. SCSIO 43702]QYX58321.1 magnesium transporter [Roseovarius sp. SCSIO 43702]
MNGFANGSHESAPGAGATPGEIAAFLTTAPAMDVATWLDLRARADAWSYLRRLDAARRGAVFSNMSESRQDEIAQALGTDELAGLVAEMDADDRVDLFNRLPDDLQARLRDALDPAIREDILRLSVHDDETAGALMTSDYAVLGRDMTAGEALDALRREAADAETIYRSYVLDEAGRLVGAIRLHELILAAGETPITELMEPAPVSVRPETDREDVARMIAHYDILALPVIDAEGRLVGIVTHDDAADAMQAETTEDFQKISTVLPFSQSLRDASVRVLYSRRIVWLALLVVGNLFSGAGIAYFEETILAYVSLVFFLPLLIDSSGNAGSQSATLMVRALATGDVRPGDWGALILREAVVAAALGATMAAVVFPLGRCAAGRRWRRWSA